MCTVNGGCVGKGAREHVHSMRDAISSSDSGLRDVGVQEFDSI